jgi:oligoribonuclease
LTDEQTRLLWLDLETTGLDDDDVILEIGAVVTEADLESVAAFHCLIAHDVDRLRMNEWCWKTHTGNGILEEIRARMGDTRVRTSGQCDAGPFGTLPGYHASLASIDWAENLLADFVRGWAPQAPLCGSTIRFDREILRRHCPKVLTFLHYRTVDVSSFREVLRRWRPDVALPDKSERHRVFDDLWVSIGVANLVKSLLAPLHDPEEDEVPRVALSADELEALATLSDDS